MFYVYYSPVFSLLNNVARAVAAWLLKYGSFAGASIMTVKGSTDEGSPIFPNITGEFIRTVSQGATAEEFPIFTNANAASILKSR